MTVFFHDVHKNDELEQMLKEDQIIGAMVHELLYADDTIIYSKNLETLTKLLQRKPRKMLKIRSDTKRKHVEAISIQKATNVSRISSKIKFKMERK